MATIVQKPEALSLLRNMKSYRINSSTPVSFKLMLGSNTILEESYEPNDETMVDIDITEVVSQYLTVKLPSSDIFSQSSALATFTAEVDGAQSHSFTVIRGGARKLSDTASNFLKANWLTWQPQTKKVRWNQPEFLSYYHEVAGVVKAKFYPTSASEEVVTIHSASAGEYNTYNMEMAHIFSLSSYDISKLNGLVDVWVETSAGVRLSYIQRYIFSPISRTEHYYMCVNSLGGIDTFCFTGSRTLSPSLSHESAMLSSRKINITTGQEREWSQNTGHLGKTEAAWIWEFFASDSQWAIIDNEVESIILDSSSIKSSDKDNITSSDFSFSLAEDGQLLKINRSNEEFPMVQVQSPSGDIFFLAPRVIDYPDANLEDSLLFLVQSPFVQEWKKISLGTLKLWIKEIFTPYEDLPLRLEILTDGDGFLAWGESTRLTCKVWKGVYEEVTGSVIAWEITRNSGVPIEDAAWLLKDKVRAFHGSIDIAFSLQENDLGETTTATGTTFTIKAHIESQTASADITI